MLCLYTAMRSPPQICVQLYTAALSLLLFASAEIAFTSFPAEAEIGTSYMISWTGADASVRRLPDQDG